MSISSKITPFLWFTAPQALHAAEFYVNLFNNAPNSQAASAITATTKIPSTQTSSTGGETNPNSSEHESIMTVDFHLHGQSFIALNGNKEGSEMPWKFNEAVSFSIKCADQAEVDYFWDAITRDGGVESNCGWCKDRWGVCWQVVPEQLGRLMGDADPGRKERVTKKLVTMKKLDVAVLEEAARGE